MLLTLADIASFYTFADASEDLIADGTAGSSDRIYRLRRVNELNARLRSECSVRQSRGIQCNHIHGDASDNRDAMIIDISAALVAQHAKQAVGIAEGGDSDAAAFL